MSLYAPFNSSSLPLLPPLLYLSPRLTPLRPYSNAVLSRLIRPDIDFYGQPSQWLIKFDNHQSKQRTKAQMSSDLSERHPDPEKLDAVNRDPRIPFAKTEFRTLRQQYRMPKNVLTSSESCSQIRHLYSAMDYSALILSVSLLVGRFNVDIGGFEALELPPLATIHYWRGIKEALEAAGCKKVIITRVPRTASIEERAEILQKEIATKCEHHESINLLGHSMVFAFSFCLM